MERAAPPGKRRCVQFSIARSGVFFSCQPHRALAQPPGQPRRHLRRIHQPDPPPALRQQPRPRRRDLRPTVRVRVAAPRRPAPLPAVEPQTRTRAVQHHRRHPPATLAVVLAGVQQYVRQRPPHFGRRPLQNVMEAVGQYFALAPEDPVHAARETRRQAFHAVRQAFDARRLHEEVRMVVLDRVVDHPEPGTRRALAQRVPEGAHEAPAAQRRHVVEDAQRDEHRAASRDGAAAAVRDPRAADARPSRARPCAAAAGRPELEAGLARPAAPSGLTRSPLALGSGTTFPLHEASPLWSCIQRRDYSKNTVYVNSITAERRPSTRPPANRNIALFNLGARTARPTGPNRRRICAGQPRPRMNGRRSVADGPPDSPFESGDVLRPRVEALRPCDDLAAQKTSAHGTAVGGVVHALSMVSIPSIQRGAVVKGWATPRQPRPVQRPLTPKPAPPRMKWAMFGGAPGRHQRMGEVRCRIQ